MIEIEIPKDIRKYDSKVVGPLSARQAISVAVGAPIAIGMFFLLEFLPSDTRLFVSGLFAVPALLFGFYKPYGMKLEDFIRTAATSALLSPKRRLYKTENIYGEKITQPKPVKANGKNKTSGPVHKESKNYIAFE